MRIEGVNEAGSRGATHDNARTSALDDTLRSRRSRPAMWAQQRKAALAIAAEWSVPGMAPDDVRQEALLALWVASGKHDPARGPWPPFARLAVKAHLRDLLQATTRQKRTAVVVELDADRDPSPVQLDLLAEQRDRLRDGLADAERLTATRARWRANKRRQRQAA